MSTFPSAALPKQKQRCRYSSKGMASASMISFWGKDVYVYGYSLSLVRKYMLLIVASCLASVMFLWFFNSTDLFEPIELSPSVYMCLLYTLFTCVSSFFEMYYGKRNNNAYILKSSLIACSAFFVLIFGIGVSSLTNLTFYMLLYSTCYLLLIISKIVIDYAKK